MPMHPTQQRPDAVHRYVLAVSACGAQVWLDASIVEDYPSLALVAGWVHADPAIILAHARTLYDARLGMTETLAPVAVFVRETAPLSRYETLVRDGHLRGVRVLCVARDGSVATETSRYAPTETDRDEGAR